jgi:RimJ/RimL family protein N-acetyltransferase
LRIDNHPDKEDLILREVEEADLPVLFDQQRDPQANYMAAFTPQEPDNREAFTQRWERFQADQTIINRTIVFRGQIAGSVASFVYLGEREVTYWIGREYWGQGIATRALKAFLEQVSERPLFARAAKDNQGSIRVLEKCGFRRIGEDKGFANARDVEVEEFVYRLDG